MGKFVQCTDKLGKEILYTPCTRVPVEEITSRKYQKIIKLMKRKVSGEGIGLAANQIGEHVQIFLIDFKPASDEPYLQAFPMKVFINPIITKASANKISWWHGCLSAQNHPLGEVATYEWIEYEAYDENGEKISGRLDNMAAIIFQHEFRHMIGTCYVDHAVKFLSSSEFYDKAARGEEANYKKADYGVPLLLADYNIGETIEEFAARINKN